MTKQPNDQTTKKTIFHIKAKYIYIYIFFLWVRHQGPGQREDEQTKDT